jgi:hypothetical protein
MPTRTTLAILLSVLALLALSFAYQLEILDSRSVLPALIQTILATFFGATFAFKLNSLKESKKLQEDQLNALRIALFILAQQENALRLVWRDFSKWEKRPDRIFNMKPMKLPEWGNLKQDYSSLAFLLNDDPQLLLDLTIEDQRFSQAMNTVTMMSEFFVNELHPTLAAKGLHKQETTIQQANELIGPVLFGKAKLYTDQVLSHIPASVASIPAVAARVFTTGKRRFPHEKFLKIEAEATTPTVTLHDIPRQNDVASRS